MCQRGPRLRSGLSFWPFILEGKTQTTNYDCLLLEILVLFGSYFFLSLILFVSQTETSWLETLTQGSTQVITGTVRSYLVTA